MEKRNKIKYSITLYFKEQPDINLLIENGYTVRSGYAVAKNHFYVSLTNIDGYSDLERKNIVGLINNEFSICFEKHIFVAYTSYFDTGNLFIPKEISDISYEINAPIWVSIIFGEDVLPLSSPTIN